MERERKLNKLPEEIMDKIDDAVNEVRAELYRAMRTHEPMNSPHEGWAVILEEVDELWDEVKADNDGKMFAEVKQVAAMAIRFMVDLL